MSESPNAAKLGGLQNRADVSASWTFLTNHAHILIFLRANPHSVLREVSTSVGITERAVQRIVQELEEQGFLVREKVGRQNQYKVNESLPLRHPLEAHLTIGDLLRLIAK